jgi:hypothetical protein
MDPKHKDEPWVDEMRMRATMDIQLTTVRKWTVERNTSTATTITNQPPPN